MTKQRPEWHPDQAGPEFASEVMKGVEGGHDGLPGITLSPHATARRPKALSTEEFVAGVRAQDRSILARAITLIESNAVSHIEQAQQVLQALLPETGRSVRIGVTGVPGAGKSTFIEAFGSMLCDAGHKVAVLAVDPSSTKSGGSILGDKTRMESLARREEAFIRPSPSGGMLGGIARKTRETTLLCEAAGFDVVLVETVGVGQGEVMVRSMVDFFLLLMLPGAGDELQGIKKGVIELADLLFINKADGDNVRRAEAAAGEYSRVLRFLQPATEGWRTEALTGSALTSTGIPELWERIRQFRLITEQSGAFYQRRSQQTVEWVHLMLEEELKRRFRSTPEVSRIMPGIEQDVQDGRLPATAAVQALLKAFGTRSPEGDG